MVRYFTHKKVVFSVYGILITFFQTICTLPCRLMLRIWGGYKVTMHIPGQLQPNRRYVIAANHQSMLDPFAIFALMPSQHRLPILPIKFMARPTLYHNPLLKPFMFVLGSFPAHIKHHPHHTYGVEGSIALLRQGYNICIFPEGTRTVRSKSRARSGVSRILSDFPEATLILARIDWRRKGWRRYVAITLALPPKGLNTGDPTAIMDAIYSL